MDACISRIRAERVGVGFTNNRVSFMIFGVSLGCVVCMC